MFRVFINPKVCGQYCKNTKCNSGLKKKKKSAESKLLYSLLKLFYFNGINKEHTEHYAKLICLEQNWSTLLVGEIFIKILPASSGTSCVTNSVICN